MQHNSESYGGLERYWEPPAHLSPRTADLWRELVPSDSRSPERLAALLLALEALDMVDDCNRRLAADGLTIRTVGSNNLRPHPLLAVRADAVTQFTKCWRLLGLTKTKIDTMPLSLLRVNVANESENEIEGEIVSPETEEYPNTFSPIGE